MFTLATMVRYEEEIKKSRFEAIAVPVENEQRSRLFLEAVKDPSTTLNVGHGKLGSMYVLTMMVNPQAQQGVRF